MKDITTTDLADFGYREIKEAACILSLWVAKGLPEGFYNDAVRLMMNRNSGYVFLTNSEYQTAMMNGDKLEVWHNCSNCGNEGFEEECKISEDREYCSVCQPKEEIL